MGEEEVRARGIDLMIYLSSPFFRKNNLAAKKSRDARRVRENQLRLRVLCLENANRVLREQMDRKEAELVQLR